MKASTLFAITVAVLLGLAAMVGARMFGLFKDTARAEEPPQPLKILVAKQNLYKDIAATAAMVEVLTIEEGSPSYQQFKTLLEEDKVLPASVEAAHLRIPNRNIEARTPLLKDYFYDLGIPDQVALRLGKGMRAVNIGVPKERAAGGLIQKGEYVDVLLTTKICDGVHCEQAITQTAVIARGLRVVVKRNILWTVLEAPPEDKPINFTLETNAYRAALIEMAQSKGMFTLVPTSRFVSAGGIADAPPPDRSDSPEFRDDAARSEAVLAGMMTVGEADLERIFKLQPIPRPEPPPEPIRITRLNGIDIGGTSFFDHKTGRLLATVRPRNGDNQGLPQPEAPAVSRRPVVEGQSAYGYQFHLPDCCTTGPTGQPRIAPGGA